MVDVKVVVCGRLDWPRMAGAGAGATLCAFAIVSGSKYKPGVSPKKQAQRRVAVKPGGRGGGRRKSGGGLALYGDPSTNYSN